MTRRAWSFGVESVAALALLVVGCTVSEPARHDSGLPRPETSAVRPVSLPDLALASESAQDQIRQHYASLLQAIEDAEMPPLALADEYGAMGNLLLAAEFFDVAETCYANAQALAPDDMRWPYYRGHVYRAKGAHDLAVASFERVLELRPDDVPALVWLGEENLAQDRPEAAELPLTTALSIRPGLAAALSGLGRAALARREYARAVEYLGEALERAPQALSVHYPLAMAYRSLGKLDKAAAHLEQRGNTEILMADPLMAPLAMAYRSLGKLDKAAAHLEQRGNTEILMADPLMQELSGLLRSVSAYETSGIRALEYGEWEAAAEFFREGIALQPDSASLRHRLGTALSLMGDVPGAREQFEEALRLSPEFAAAHYSLGVMMASDARYEDAIRRFEDAVRHEPDYVEALLLLGDLLRHLGPAEDALTHFERVITIDPGVAEARLGLALALVRLEHYAEARDRLTEGIRVLPDQPELVHALARLLAAAPDDAVRDGQRALSLMEGLIEQQRTVENAETMAMTLAELGRYDEAATLQRDVLATAREQGWPGEILEPMIENLRLYEGGRPCRTPWTAATMP